MICFINYNQSRFSWLLVLSSKEAIERWLPLWRASSIYFAVHKFASGTRFLGSKWLFFKSKWLHIKTTIFNIGSKIPHKFANLVLICESQSNQRRPNLTWDLCFAFIDQMVLVNNLLQVIDLVIHIHEFGVWSLNLIAITILLIHIRSFIPNSFYFMLFSTCRLFCQSSLFHWANKSGPFLQSCCHDQASKSGATVTYCANSHSTNMQQQSTMPVSSIMSFL
jgi:hypothetical protein